jgi:hypothetical protein
VTSELLEPNCWLVIGQQWSAPEGQVFAEAAYALAPSLVPRDKVSRDAADVLDLAEAYVRAIPGKAVFFSDLTLWLDQSQTTWHGRGTDWEAAVDELVNSPLAALYLTISRRAHLILCDASPQGAVIYFPDGRTEQITSQERQAVHDALEQQLRRDWPPYMQRVLRQS